MIPYLDHVILTYGNGTFIIVAKVTDHITISKKVIMPYNNIHHGNQTTHLTIPSIQSFCKVEGEV